MEAYQWNPYIRYVDLRTCSASYKTSLMAYDYRLFAICGGECTLYVEEKEFSLSKDTCLIIPPARPYRFIFNERAPVTLYNINFSLSYLPGNGRALHPDEAQRFSPEKMPEAPDTAFFPSPLLVENAGEICREIGALLSERERREFYFDEICSSLLKCALLKLLRLSRAGERLMPEPVSAVKRYLEEHCRESISGEQLGRMFGYHPFYLNRLFRQHTGQTMHLFQMKCRMQLACAMLTSTLLNVKEIADSLGFSSPAYFSELFKKLRGVSPSDYREGAR